MGTLFLNSSNNLNPISSNSSNNDSNSSTSSMKKLSLQRSPIKYATSPEIKSVVLSNSKESKTSSKTYEKRKKNSNTFKNITNNKNNLVLEKNVHILPEKTILKRLLSVQKTVNQKGDIIKQNVEVAEVSAINNRIIRKYFRELTENFLAPFDRYFRWSTELLNRKDFNPYLTPPRLSDFSDQLFLEWLKKEAPNQIFNNLPCKHTLNTSKRQTALKIYAKFLKSPHYPRWFAEKRLQSERRMYEAVYRKIRRLHVKNLVAGMSVADGVKMHRNVLKLIDRVAEENPIESPQSRSLIGILKNHVKLIELALPAEITLRLRKKEKNIVLKKTNQLMSFPHKLEIKIKENYF